jgi:hypothetical protein
MTMGAVITTPPHVARTVPVPGFVLAPITHDHVALPAEFADWAPNPAAVLAVPAGVV